MVNYEIDPAALAPLVPAGTELDELHGRVFVSMVGFLFLKTRVFGVPFPWHQNFEEVNLRFYVRRWLGEAAGWRRGAVFVREIVPKRIVATVARVIYNEPYLACPMEHRVERSPGTTAAEYRWRHAGRWNALSVTAAGGEPEDIAPGSEEEFITEHYWGYNRQRDGGTMEYAVEHPRWRVWPARDYGLRLRRADALRRTVRAVPGGAGLVGVPGGRRAGQRPVRPANLTRVLSFLLGIKRQGRHNAERGNPHEGREQIGRFRRQPVHAAFVGARRFLDVAAVRRRGEVARKAFQIPRQVAPGHRIAMPRAQRHRRKFGQLLQRRGVLVPIADERAARGGKFPLFDNHFHPTNPCSS